MASRIAILLIDFRKFRCGRICTDASRRALPHSTSSTLPYSLLYPAGEEGVDTLPGKPAAGPVSKLPWAQGSSLSPTQLRAPRPHSTARDTCSIVYGLRFSAAALVRCRTARFVCFSATDASSLKP